VPSRKSAFAQEYNRHMRLQPGVRLGVYQIVSPIGAGGMGEVYRARDARLDRDVAIKVLPERLATDPQALARFEREVRAVAALSHPNILSIYDFGTTEGVTYAVTELLLGETLRQRLKRGHVSLAQAVEIGTGVAEGLAAAHAGGFIHRDLKPENIFLTADGPVRILDFGLARSKVDTAGIDASVAPTETQPGTILGTAAYMSPEQVRGAAADAPSDIFSLGCVLYEMITGRNPFSRETGAQTMTAILEYDPPRLRESIELDRLVARCLKKNPAQRFQSARDLAFALSGLFAHQLSARSARPRIWLPLTAIFLVLAVACLWLWPRIRWRADVPRIGSLAVLPLQNLSHDAEQEYFADGTTEALISTLAQIRALRVVSRTSVMRYKGSKKSLPEIGGELHVDAVLEGSVQRAGNRIRITAQLIHTATDAHIWAKQYERDLSDILTLQSDVARAVANEIRIQVTPQESARLNRTRPVHPQAHEAYLLGRYNLWKSDETNLAKAVRYFERAIELDPAYPAAYAGLSSAWRRRATWGDITIQQAEPQVRVNAGKAVELDDNLAEAHHASAALKYEYDWDWAGAETEFRRAIDLDSNSPDAHFDYAFLLQTLGRVPEAVAEIRRAKELDPVSSAIESAYGRVLYRARRYDEAIAHLQRAVELDPQNRGAYGRFADVYEQLGDFPQALAMQDKAAGARGGGFRIQGARIYAVMGRRAEALQILGTVRAERRPKVSPVQMAEVYIALGDKEESFAWLEKAFTQHDQGLRFIKTDQKFDALRSDPRFAALLRRLHLGP